MADISINYAEKTTLELLDLLVKEEDRVTLEHIQELAARPDAIEPLRAWLADMDRWMEAEHGEWWALYHAFTILSLTRRPELLDDLLEALKYAYLEEFDWLQEISPAALAQFGPAGIEQLTNFINSSREIPRNSDTTSWRSRASTALTRIALEHPTERPRIAEFIIGRFTDPEETDETFLGFLIGDALMLDFERAKEPLRAAFERNAVDESISGNYQQSLDWFAKFEKERAWEYTQDLLKFYRPEEIARRQARWQREKEEEERQAKQQESKVLAHRLGWDVPDEPAIPKEGYIPTSTGTVVREEAKVGRNDPCPCGSGKKYKKCCGA
jgi:hypothetical protein